MSAQDNSNVQAQAQAQVQAEAQQAGNAQANAQQPQQVPAPQVIGGQAGVQRGPALFGPGGFYQGPISRRVGPNQIIRGPGPALFSPGGVYQGPISRRVGTTTRILPDGTRQPVTTQLGGVRTTTRVVRPDGTTVLQAAPTQNRVIREVRYGGFQPLGGFIPGPRVVVPAQAAQAQAQQADAQAQQDAAQQEAEAQQVQAQGNPFAQPAKFGPPVTEQIIELTAEVPAPVIEYPYCPPVTVDAPPVEVEEAPVVENVQEEVPVIDAPVQLMGGFAPQRELATEDLELINGFRQAIEEALGQTFEAWEPQAVQTQVVAGTNYRFFINTNAGLVQATIYRDLQGNAELSSLYPPVIVAQ